MALKRTFLEELFYRNLAVLGRAKLVGASSLVRRYPENRPLARVSKMFGGYLQPICKLLRHPSARLP